ncbi:MAG: DUF4331 domain-containing protein [Gammaproteobacteria bacterium]
MNDNLRRAGVGAATAALVLASGAATASSHMDAPLITLDPAANTTDVYAFVDEDPGAGKQLVVGLGVYPFEEPGIGPNKYNFDDGVRYEIHVATGNDVRLGRPSLTYRFEFQTRYRNTDTILQSYLGVVEHVDDAAQNLTQTYTVTRIDRRGRGQPVATVLGSGVVPPNNQGIATPYYNQGDDGNAPARDGVASQDNLDRYTAESIAQLDHGYVAFAGQRDDGFYGDIQSIFDLLQLRSLRPGAGVFDSQGGYNIHAMALKIPVGEIGGDQQIVGVYATTSRRRIRVLGSPGEDDDAQTLIGNFRQVGRQGNPLFNEGLVAIADKDLYNRSSPAQDDALFRKYAENPELARLINLLVIPGSGLNPAVESGRTDLSGIFIPDLIKVDLSTGPARLAGGGAGHPANPDDPGYSRLGIFGGDVLVSAIQPGFGSGTVPGGWPNGRRFGDDVVDIGVTAIISDLRGAVPIIQGPVGDGVDRNDIAYNKVFPYEATPHNGRNHAHHGEAP